MNHDRKVGIGCVVKRYTDRERNLSEIYLIDSERTDTPVTRITLGETSSIHGYHRLKSGGAKIGVAADKRYILYRGELLEEIIGQENLSKLRKTQLLTPEIIRLLSESKRRQHDESFSKEN